MAGVPFDVVEALATPQTSAAARKSLIRQSEFAITKAKVEQLLQSRRHDLSKEQFQAWRKTVRLGVMPPPSDPSFGIFADCYTSGFELLKCETELDECLRRELEQARGRLMRDVR